MKTTILNIDYFELGALRGALDDKFKKLPERLQLKLNILMTQAYLGSHFDKQAKKDLIKYRKELKLKK